jgi:FAD/FMN-containing dehydrogenase
MGAVSDVLSQLETLLGASGFTTDPVVSESYLAEWRGRYRGETPFIALPTNSREVAEIVRICARAGIAITPQGGNTGLVGGQIPQGEVLVSLRRMKRILDIDPLTDSMTVEAGVVLANVQAAAANIDRLFPMSLGSEGSATVGGLISTNAGGVHVMRYGMMRDLVMGLEVVLPNGQVLSALQPLRKDNTGYDLKHLFVGAEGTLGIVTAATLKLCPRSREHVVALAAVNSADDALSILQMLRSATDSLTAFEIMNAACVQVAVEQTPVLRHPFPCWKSWVVLIEFQAVRDVGLMETVEHLLADAMEAALIADVIIANSERQSREFWHLRESISGAQRALGAQSNHDISVPVSAVPEFLRSAAIAAHGVLSDVRILAFGHAGDGNVHYTVAMPATGSASEFENARAAIAEAVYSVVMKLGGSFSAEHGIGVARRDDLYRFKSSVALELMKAIKTSLDPQGIMNPRAMLRR